MDYNKLLDLIKVNTDIPRWNRGVKYYNKKLVDHVSFNINENIITLEGVLESEFNNEVYTNTLSIDPINFKIIGGRCTCEDFRSKSTGTKLFICKHLAATSISAILMAKKDFSKAIITKFEDEKPPKIYPSTPDKKLLEFFDDTYKKQVNLEVNLTIDEGNIHADFKIGTDKMYVLKSLKDFSNSRISTSTLDYGKNFTYDPINHYFSDIDEPIVDIIEEYGANYHPHINSTINPKILDLGESGLKRFLKTLKNKDFTLNYKEEVYRPKINENLIPINFDFKKLDNKIELSSQCDMPIPLTSKGDVVLYEENIYLLNNEDSLNYKKIYEILNESKTVVFDKEDMVGLLGHLVPKLKQISEKVILDEEIKNNIISDFKVEFYFDFKHSDTICDLKFVYNDENGQKFILPDKDKEKEISNILISFGFVKESNTYIFKEDDLHLFNFLDKEIHNLKDIGEVYYSDKFKSKKIYNSSSIQASIKNGIDGYLDFDFSISDIDKDEYKDILLAFKEKSKFYKLKDGSFINLTQRETKDFFELIDNLDLINDMENKRVHASKGLYINDVLNSKNLDFVKGTENLQNICDRFKNIDSINFDIPNSLNATLRDYQVNGLNWLKTLDHYEFGGILADEMGLGKTIQTIAFLLSKKEEKAKSPISLIITPTSLIYNWKNEFETFAPNMNVSLIHGNKKERDKTLENLEGVDVIITTYGTLRNDLDSYLDKTFDYCIIDEGQNIKNPVALSTEAVKSINAKVRFSLTGTPIENNLLELWSIFDFIMPGYLYSRKRFYELFINNEDNTYNLKKLIQPFILRRTKSEVMKELPDKIEKKFFVELNKDQKRIYGAYVKDIQEKMVDKDVKKDKIVIFSYLTKLRQLCLDPRVILEDYNSRSSKIETTIELLNDYIENGHKILLFSQFTSVLKNIGDELSNNNITYSYIDGSTPAKERLSLVNKFNETDENKVFLISLKAGGTGLNLTSADVVIHFDPWWNPSVENQASDRAHRYGQKNVVEVIKLIAKGTIEEKIVKLQESKNELINEFINGDLSNGNLLKTLSDKDIIDLFN
ncbi:DEAD/DEAH box helicase [[Clostridium] dakarense]|uniref:DEAD/DEAH box helicase n=1 Tax=Faecalimicrobium dakarense TaxID=1301100 RepID=UPI0004ADE9A0|nr:DEAD/DEAH box helicase [[Clostridium] dakarense]